MPTLDPILSHPSRTGPSRDYKAIAAKEPIYRQEAFQIAPQRMPVSMNANLKPRPLARSGGNPDTNLPLFRVPVLVRSSNQRPQESGESSERGVWALSDPSQPSGMMPGMGAADMLPGMGADAPAPTSMLSAKSLAIGVALGLAAWCMIKRKG